MKLETLSWGYRLVRRSIIRFFSILKSCLRQEQDLESAICFGDKLFTCIPRFVRNRLFRFSTPAHLHTEVHGLQFRSPIIVSSFKDDVTLIDFWLGLGMGAATIKTIYPHTHPGNPRPRIQAIQCNGDDALINAVGLPGKGCDGMLSVLDHNPQLFSHDCPIGLSVGGHAPEDYLYSVERITKWASDHPQHALFLELNVSCPNTPDGQDMMKKPDLLSDLIKQVRDISPFPFSIKLSPDLSDEELLDFAKRAKAVPRTMISIGNTSFRKCEDVGLRPNAISVGGGGLSGPPLYDRTLEMTKLLAPVGIPLIAIGGVRSAAQCQELLESGASLVGMATALVFDPFVIPKIHRSLD